MLLDLDAHLGHRAQHFGAHVLHRVLRRHREIARLGADAVTEIAALIFGVGVDRQFGGVELEAGVVGRGLEADVVEHEEFGFGAEEHGIAHAHRLDHGFGFLGHAAGVAVVGLARGRLQHVAGDDHGGFRKERIDRCSDGIGHQAHVGFVDRLPAGDRGAVEHRALGEDVLIDHADVESYMLPLAARVGKTQIDVFHVVVLDRFQDVFGGLHESPLGFLVVLSRPQPATVGNRQYNWGMFNTISENGHGKAGRVRSDGVEPGCPGSDANGFFDVGNEDLSVADTPGLGRPPDRVDRPVDQFVRNYDFDLHLGEGVYNVLSAAVEFGMALLAAETLGFGDGYALQSHFLERF